MANGRVVSVFVGPAAGEPMMQVDEVQAIRGAGMEGDRYCTGDGSWNKGNVGKRQVTLINACFFENSGFNHAESRRNIVTDGVELMDLIGKVFMVGSALLKGVKYCDPCMRPSKLSSKERSFRDAFHDRGGLVAEVLESGRIYTDAPIAVPTKNY